MDFILEIKAKIGTNGLDRYHILIFHYPVVSEQKSFVIIDEVEIFDFRVCKHLAFGEQIAQVVADFLCNEDFVVESLTELKEAQTSGEWPIFIEIGVLEQGIGEDEEDGFQVQIALIDFSVKGRVKLTRFSEAENQCIANSFEIAKELCVYFAVHVTEVLTLWEQLQEQEYSLNQLITSVLHCDSLIHAIVQF